MSSLDSISPTAWIVANGIINENQKPVEFRNHRFLIEPFDDMHHDIVSKKSAQVGFSVLSILKSAWLAKYKGLNSIYVLPTQDIVKSFVNPKVDPLIASNKVLKDMVAKDSVTLKQVGDRFVHYKGSSSQREAISTSADLLIIDEYDRCLSMEVLNTYDSRLQASEWGWRWRFSNPSAIGFGVDALYQDSDQRHWFVKCSHCGHRWFMDFERDETTKSHYVDMKRKIYACGKCDRELTDSDRRNGEWIQKYPSVDRHGYWFSQMMAPWVTAKRILEQKEDSSPDFFYNFVLGKAYTPSDMVVNRETILRATAPSDIPRLNVSIGVDQNVSEQIWVAGTPQGIFAHGKAKSWEEIEHLKLMWNAVVVCDPNPYSTMPKMMAKKYSDWYMCYFKAMDGMEIINWKGSVVYADRTRLLDTVANEIAEARILFREHPYALEDYIKDWSNIYRTTVEKEDGRIKSEWLKKEGQLSDFSFATAYMRIGLSRIIGGNATFVEPGFDTSDAPVTDTLTESGRYQTTLTSSVEDTFKEML